MLGCQKARSCIERPRKLLKMMFGTIWKSWSGKNFLLASIASTAKKPMFTMKVARA